jgi:BirA family biotin operon repressor/biotin-[acetyl-CoA-carboxylase] ligase
MTTATPPSNAAPDHFTPEDLARIVADTFIDHVDYHAELNSTNSRAAALTTAASPLDHATILVLADHQTAGRGRGTNQWWSTPGALTFSILLRPDALKLPTNRWPLVSLTAGLAVCEAIESLDSTLALHLKWPNDVYLGGRKLCGILIEAATGERNSILLGIGLNINNSATTAPPELREKVIALCDATDHNLRRADALVAVLHKLAAALDELSTGADHLQQKWTERCLLTGRSVEIALPTRRIIGLCRGIAPDGALLVETDAGLERCLSGIVARFD